MTSTQSAPVASAAAPAPTLPLQPEDPPRVGEFWLRGRISANAAGYLYAGQDDAGRPAVVVMMTEGSADDPAARDRFRRGVALLPARVVLARNSPDDDDVALWVAVGADPDTDPDTDPADAADSAGPQAFDRQSAEQYGGDVLSAVLMDRIPQLGRFRGPDFLHHWDSRRRPGLFRLWPLPWPGALKPASWIALVLAMVAMLLLMAAAVFIAWLLFRHQPEVDPGPPIPQGTRTVTGSPSTTGPGSSGTGSLSPTPSPTLSGTTTVPTPSGTGRFPTSIPTDLPSSPSSVNPEDRY